MEEIEEIMLLGRRKFNGRPRHGIRYLQFHGILGQSATDVAECLLQEKGLSKKAIGEYLGAEDEFNTEVLRKFFLLQNFRGKHIVGALQSFLGTLHLPSEGLRIDLITRQFTAHYVSSNPDIILSTDSACVLSHSIMMLRTNPHHPGARQKLGSRKKMAKKQFITQNSGIQDVPKKFLKSVFKKTKRLRFVESEEK